MPLKGSLLNARYYAAPGLRPMNDLDLLVRPIDGPRMRQVLASLGYRQIDQNWKHVTFARPGATGPIVAWDGEHPANPRAIDIHTRLSEQYWGMSYDATEIAWHDSDSGPLLGTYAHVLQPAALLNHILLHASTNALARQLRQVQLHDIALVAQQVDDAGWDRIVREARARREERLVWPPLVLTHRFWPVIPERIMRALEPGVPAALARHVYDHDLDHWSACNLVPRRLEERICWLRPGREYLVALRHALLRERREVARRYPALARRRLLPVAYLCYEYDMLSRSSLGMLRIVRRRLWPRDQRET
jgi:hypothetical protein